LIFAKELLKYLNTPIYALSSIASARIIEGSTEENALSFLKRKSGARKRGMQGAFFFGVRRVFEAVAGRSFSLFAFVQNSSE